MLKYFVILIVVLYSSLSAIDNNWYNINAPQYLTSVSGFSSNDQIYASETDSQNNLIVVGYFEGKMKFGSFTIISYGDKDLFIAKRSSSGNWLWAVNAGGVSADYAIDVTTDQNDNLYVTGYFYDNASFGSYTLESSGVSDVYVASLDEDGNWRWAVNAGGSSYDKGVSIKSDNSSNLFVTGSFQSTAYFASDELISNGNRDIFIARMDFDGNFINSVGFGSSSNDDVKDIDLFDNGNIAIAGQFTSEMILDDITLNSAGQDDGFIAICDTSLTFTYANSVGSSSKDAINSIEISDSLIYATGYFSGTADFDDIQLTSEGARDVYLAVLDTNLAFNNVLVGGGSQDDEGISLKKLNSNIYLTGYFRSSADFGTNTVNSNGDKDVFVAVVDTNFNWNTINSGGSTSVDESIDLTIINNSIYIVSNFFRTAEYDNFSSESIGGFDIVIAEASLADLTWTDVEHLYGFRDLATTTSINRDVMGNKYITGSFYGQLNFGRNILSAQKASDGFIAKSGPAGSYIWVKTIKTNNDATILSVDTDEELNVYVCGSFSGTADFGNIQKESDGLSDIFVGKIDKDGNWQWVVTTGNFLFDEALDIKYYDDDHIYVTGYYSYSVEFGDDDLSGSPASEIFIASIDTDGNWQWAKKAGGLGYDVGEAVTTDSFGNCIVTGTFEGTADFGSDEIESYGNDDFFITKLSSEGQWIWTNYSGSNTWRDAAYDVVTDNQNNIYITGQFNNYATFDGSYLISNGDLDAFIVQIDSNGDWGFLKSIGGDSFDSGSALFCDNNDLYFTGIFSESIEVDGVTYTAESGNDIYFGKLNVSDGSYDWFDVANGSSNDEAVGVILDKRNNLHYTGNFLDSLKVNGFQLANNTNVDKKFFVASYGKKTPPYQWNYKGNTASSSTIIIPDSINPKLNSDDFTEYDAVGIYYASGNEKIFGGFAHWNNETMEITVWQDDLNTSLVEGFTNGEEYQYELWDYETENLYETDVYYLSGSEVFADEAESVIKYLPKPEDDSVQISLNPGWNLISSYLEPYDTDIESIFSSVENDIAIVRDEGDFYIPRFSFITMDDWNYRKAYRVYSKNSTDFTIDGFYFPNTSYSVNLNEGWNYLPYLKKDSMQISQVFESLIDSNVLIIAKDDEGNLFIPALSVDGIGNMTAGEGYYIYVNQAIEFIFPVQ